LWKFEVRAMEAGGRNAREGKRVVEKMKSLLRGVGY
jgi:hypothetical protein